jgi:uncharacterized protein (DUF488 family)
MIATQTLINPQIFTVGYERVSIEKFIRKLVEKKIQRIIDVRCNPISRKPGFSKTALRTKLQEAGIEYVHLPELGIPSSLRKSLQTDDDYSALFLYYEEHILPNVAEKIAEAITLLKEMPSAFLCFEEDPKHCHRTRLAHYIARETDLTEVPLRIQ